jgi:Zn-finger nucleic acid-binding protein
MHGSLSAMVTAINSARKHRFEGLLKKYKNKLKKLERKEKLKLKMGKNDLELAENINQQILTNSIDHSDYNCPECSLKMCNIVIKNEAFGYCPMCRGCWIPDGILQKYTDFNTDVPSSHLVSRKSKYNCPICNNTMRECVFLKPFNLLVDVCDQTHGCYLENGEFDRAIIITLPKHKKT